MTRTYDVAKALLDGVAAKLPPDGQPGRACVVPGSEAAWDDCCDGQLAVVMPVAYAAEEFPGEAGSGSAGCGAAYLVQRYVVELVRCVHTQDEGGTPPTCDDLDADAQQLAADAAAVRAGADSVLMTLASSQTIADYQIGDQPAVGPQGGCAGSQLNVVVGFPGGC